MTCGTQMGQGMTCGTHIRQDNYYEWLICMSVHISVHRIYMCVCIETRQF